jgi:hypothetical protein
MNKLFPLLIFAPAFLIAQNPSAVQTYPKFGTLTTYPVTCSYKATSFVDDTQDDSTETQKKFIKVISIAGYGGGNLYRDGYEDRTIFQQAVPGNPMMFADLTGYGNQMHYYDYGFINANVTTGLMISTRLRCQKKFSELRLGISHSLPMVSEQYYVKESTTQIGTSALPGGETLITDSTHHSSYQYKWYTDVLSLDISWIVKSDPGKIFNCYTGFGLTGGVGYNGVISAEHREYSYHTNRSNGPSYLYYQSNATQHTTTSSRSAAPIIAQFGGYIPIGFNIRLGKRQTFFSHLTLFGEYQGAMYLLSCPGITSKLRTSSNVYGGVRYYIRAPKHVGKHNRHRNRRNPEGRLHMN